MNKRERHRLKVFQQIKEGMLLKKAAAAELLMSSRQVRKRYQQWLAGGDSTLISRKRGCPGNRRRTADERRFIAWYSDLNPHGRYRPQLASEQFASETGISISAETARQWLIKAQLWRCRRRKTPTIHPPRLRRTQRGELVQVDGCDHEWFAGMRFTLLQFIDDATSEILFARFVPSESTNSYFMALEAYIGQHGCPIALYTDRHTAFSVNTETKRDKGITQFGRALRTLQIAHLLSSTPQSRGRVERAHQLAQDRLLKVMANELDITGLTEDDAMALANACRQPWISDINARCAKSPASDVDAHRPCQKGSEQLQRILSCQFQRQVSKNRTFSYCRRLYVIDKLPSRLSHWRLLREGVCLHERYDGECIVTCDGHRVVVRLIHQGEAPPQVVSNKELNKVLDTQRHPVNTPWRPASHHPWRRYQPPPESR